MPFRFSHLLHSVTVLNRHYWARTHLRSASPIVFSSPSRGGTNPARGSGTGRRAIAPHCTAGRMLRLHLKKLSASYTALIWRSRSSFALHALVARSHAPWTHRCMHARCQPPLRRSAAPHASASAWDALSPQTCGSCRASTRQRHSQPMDRMRARQAARQSAGGAPAAHRPPWRARAGRK